jgi:hypothetical protein
MGSGALTIRGTALAFAASCSLASGRAVYDLTADLLRSARLDTEPPTIVQLSQEAIIWLSRSHRRTRRRLRGGAEQPGGDTRPPSRGLDLHRRRATPRTVRLGESNDPRRAIAALATPSRTACDGHRYC